MKRTDKYQLGYFEEGDITSSVVEMQRWETLDAQLYALYDILGNGVIEGWNLLPSSGLSIVVSAGSGHVNFVAVESTENETITDLTPSARNYIYAALIDDSYWTKNVVFIATTSQSNVSDYLYLGYADTDADSVTSVNTDDRSNLGFITLITQLVAAHRHIGGTDNPPPVNLSSEVQGIINQENLPLLDASIIQTGTLDDDRFPTIDHITKLINQGTLTHAQLDSFVESLSLTNSMLMGETSTIDLLQLILALKHIYPDIDEFLVNEIAYIPGISPDNYVDWDNTTATVDVRTYAEGGQHTITGEAAAGKTVYTKTWDTEEEFSSGTSSDVIIDGSSVCLENQEITRLIDEFNDITTWEVITDDLSSLSIALSKDTSAYVVPPASGKLVVGDTTVEIALIIRKEFDAQDWSQFDYITFYIKTESVQHGDLFFYLNDDIAGTQNSHTKILNRNDVTINVDTLQNGWQEVTVNISAYTRTNINTIGFYVSSQKGWDTAKGFDLNLDNINLTSGNKYKEDGYVRVVFGNADFPYEFWRVRWDASIPTDSQSSGLEFKTRTRVGNTLADLAQSAWSAYSSLAIAEIDLPSSNLYNYIEIETFFGASTDLTRSACLLKLYLDFYASDTEGSFVYNDQDDWESGNLFNIDLNTTPDSMLIAKTEEVNDIFYGAQSKAVQLDDDLVELYKITGTTLPRSTPQAIADSTPSLGLVSGVARGDQGNIWIADIDNDRIVECDKSGGLVVGFYGSFLSAPDDPYGIEDSGPGSNIISSSTSTTTSSTTTLAIGASLGVYHSIYNPTEGALYIIFDSNLENIYDSATTLDMDRIYLKIGTQRFYLNDSTIELLGVDETKYNNWSSLVGSTHESATFINQFKFSSHVLKVTLQGADKTLLNSLVNQEAKSIVIASPEEQELNGQSVTVQFLLYNFVLGSGAGENTIRVTLDGGTPQDIYVQTITYTGLADGVHTLRAQLVDADGILNTNIEAVAESTFVVSAGSMNDPFIYITTPKPNQIYSSSPVTVEFEVDNFAVLPTGPHIRYTVDTDPPVDYYSTNPISIEDLDAGEHTIKLVLVDKNGTDLGYTYGTVTGTFIVGLNSNAVVKLYVNQGAISNSDKSIATNNIRQDVDVGTIYFNNIYSPIDIQIIPAETSLANLDGLPTILVAKLRSPSWTDGLGGSDRVAELTVRLQNEANSSSNTTSPVLSSVPTDDLLYGTKYLNGHSVVQMSMDNEIILSNNAAVFAQTKTEAKTLLGSAEKLGDSEVLIGDAYNQRAIITYTNLSSESSLIEWEYNSDRYVSDFHIVLQDDVTISVGNDAISESEVFVRQGSLVIWENNSASPISIYSGTTTYDGFYLDPDLNLYGSSFKSTVLQPGERWSFKMVTVGEFDWFVYPTILTGKITVTRNRISSRDQFIILENDGLESPFSSRAIKVDAWGNVLWEFGEAYLVKPRDCRPLISGNVIIST